MELLYVTSVANSNVYVSSSSANIVSLLVGKGSYSGFADITLPIPSADAHGEFYKDFAAYLV